MVFVIHVTMKNGVLEFRPPVQDISQAWGQFCDVLSVAAYRSLHSSLTVFEMIKNQIMLSDHQQYDHVPFIKVSHQNQSSLIRI